MAPVALERGHRARAGELAAGRALGQARRARWVVYAAVGAVSAATVGTYLVVVLVGCGLVELAVGGTLRPAGGAAGLVVLPSRLGASRIASASPTVAAPGGLAALSWVALKVGALSFGGGFVIIPLMQADRRYTLGLDNERAIAWNTTEPPLDRSRRTRRMQTIAIIGSPPPRVSQHAPGSGPVVVLHASFAFILGGAGHFSALRSNRGAKFVLLGGAGPAAVGAIAGAAIPLGLAVPQRLQW